MNTFMTKGQKRKEAQDKRAFNLKVRARRQKEKRARQARKINRK